MAKLSGFLCLFLIACFLIATTAAFQASLTRREGQGRRARGNPEDAPLLGGALNIGLIYMDLPIGTPARTFSVNVDTGSADLAIPSSSCSSCPSGLVYYDASASSSSQQILCSDLQVTCPDGCSSQNQCLTSTFYGDQSGFHASLFSDTARLGSFSPITLNLGAIYSETGQFEPSPVEGIIGFAYNTISNTQSPTLMDTLVSSGQIDNVFSMCLTHYGGVLGLGEIVPYHSGSFSYTPILTGGLNAGFYNVLLTDMGVGGNSLSSLFTSSLSAALEALQTIFDSGTTLITMPQVLIDAIYTSMVTNCGTNPLVGVCDRSQSNSVFSGNVCVKLTSSQIAAYPDLDFKFGGGATLSVPSSTYLLNFGCSASDEYYVGISATEGMIILGDVVHLPYVVVYDRVNTRIGWSPVANCPDDHVGGSSSATTLALQLWLVAFSLLIVFLASV